MIIWGRWVLPEYCSRERCRVEDRIPRDASSRYEVSLWNQYASACLHLWGPNFPRQHAALASIVGFWRCALLQQHCNFTMCLSTCWDQDSSFTMCLLTLWSQHWSFTMCLLACWWYDCSFTSCLLTCWGHDCNFAMCLLTWWNRDSSFTVGKPQHQCSSARQADHSSQAFHREGRSKQRERAERAINLFIHQPSPTHLPIARPWGGQY